MKVNINAVLRNFLFVLLIIYFAQGTLYSTGSIIGKSSLLALLIVSLYCCFKSLIVKSHKPLFFYSIAFLLLLNLIGFIVGGNYEGIYFSQLRSIATALLPFFSFYYLTKKGCLEDKHLIGFFVLMAPLAIASFYQSRGEALSELNIASESVVTNVTYLFVSLVPFVFFWGKRKVLAICSLLVLIFFIIQGAKRGALIAASVGVMVFAYYQFINIPPEKRIRGYLFALVGLFAISAFAIHFFESNEFLMRRMQAISGGGSGRERIYSHLLFAWYNSDSILNYLFGFGFVATVDKSGFGLLAHNDWLELLINFGLLGVAIYLLLFFSIARFVLSPETTKRYRLVMLAIAGMWFLQTLFSMYYTASSTAISMVVLGYLAGMEKNEVDMQGIRRGIRMRYA